MNVVGNPHRSALHNENIPDGPLTPRQRELADAIRWCSSLADTCSAPAKQVTSIPVCVVPLGTTPEAARAMVESGLERAEAELKRLRGLYHVYGPEPFMPRSVPDGAPRREEGETRHSVLVAIMRGISAMGRVMTRAGDRRVERDASGAYVLAPEDGRTGQ